MNLPNIVSKVCREPWLILPEKHRAIMDALEAKLSGDFKTIFGDDDDAPSDHDCRGEYREFQTASGTIAVIPVHGILGKHLSSIEMACGGCSFDVLQSQIKTAMESQRITKVLLDIVSPGGTVVGTPETGRLLAELRSKKPLWAFTDAEACSAAYWLAAQADSFYITESAWTGSCGVYSIYLDRSEQLRDAGLKVNAIASGKYKMLGASFKPLADEEREILQTESDGIHAEFQEAVNVIRAVDKEHLQGQIYRGEEAAGVNMVDGVINDLDDVLFQMAQPTPR